MEATEVTLHSTSDSQRQATLVAVSPWAIVSGLGWVVKAVHQTLQLEGLRYG
jgi:hypothetical protein